jgi:hypothetical protein
LALTIIRFGLLASLPRGEYLGDFGCFVLSGRAMAQGLSAYTFDPSDLAPAFTWTGTPNFNPPVLLLICPLLARLDPVVAFRIWYLVSLSLYATSLVLLARNYRLTKEAWRILWALGLAGLWATLALGQVYTPLTLACVGAWLSMERRKWGTAGVLVGIVVTMKPNFVVWPVLLLLAGHLTVAVPALLSAALFSLLPAAIYGPRIYADWLSVLPFATDFAAGTNASLMAFCARLGVPTWGLPVALSLLIALAVWVHKRRPPAEQASGVALLAAILAAPIGWIGYTLLLVPFFISIEWGPPLRVAGLLLLLPSQWVWRYSALPDWQSAVFGSVYPAALLLALCAALRTSEVGLRKRASLG